VIKVRTVQHLRSALQEKYNEYLTRTTLNTYLLPRNSSSLAAKAHHHPALVAVASVSRTEKKEHIDEHYCLSSIKGARQFAALFPSQTVIISQDDKAKVPLGIPAVGRTFQTMQSIKEAVSVADHDFPTGAQQKLIPSVYLAIDPLDSNDALRHGQLAIFIRPQYNVGTNATTHMVDLISLTNQESFASIFKNNDQIKPIWILLVDGGPDENPRHLKNIYEYCKLFQFLDLDYLTVRTHAPGQSAYNPVERSMCTLSGKLAGITLPIDKFGSHLNSQGKVINPELAKKNFCYAGEALCTLWNKDQIFGKPVLTQYIAENTVSIEGREQVNGENVEESEISWKWIENHTQICRYSLDIKKCKDISCCNPIKHEESAAFLAENNGFLPPVSKGQDGHFLNPIHILQYVNKLKLPSYDAHCPSISSEMHARLCCTICNKYFPTLAMVTKHKKSEHINSRRKKTKSKISNSIDDFNIRPANSSKKIVRECISDGE